jgi:thiamine biosynthesis lipoprotein
VQSKLIATLGWEDASLMSLEVYRMRAVHAALLVVRMVRPTVGLTACLAGGLLVGCGSPPGPAAPARVIQTARVSQTERLMGVPWTITVHADSAAAGRAAIAAGFAEVARLERILSDYDPESELSRLSALAPTRHPIPVSDDLWRVLAQAVRIRDVTDGAFDPTVGPLTSLWRQARRSGRLPLPDKLARAREAVGPEVLRLVPEARAVMLERPAMRLDLGGIGMGYAVDRAVEVLGRRGIAAGMVDASGDVAVWGAPPGTAGWKIAVAPLRAAGDDVAAGDSADQLVLAHGAVTTSGDAFQAVEIDGLRYSHIIDPRTGLGVVGPTAVTVVAPDCTTADALATAASVLGPERSAAVIAGTAGCAARFVWVEGDQVRHSYTPRWPSQHSQIAK